MNGDVIDNHYINIHTYFIYGHSIRSSWPLPILPQIEVESADFEFSVEFSCFRTSEIEKLTNGFDEKIWSHYAHLSDGSDLLRWSGLFDFLVIADGHKIFGRPLAEDSFAYFQTYLLGQVLSCALVRKGVEPLHATVVKVNDRAVAFLGDCGYGKSTLASAFIQAGFPLLTDDMLVIKQDGGNYIAYPGPPRIKLFPIAAKTLALKESKGIPLNSRATKLVFPLSQKDMVQTPVIINAFYAITPPDSTITQIKIETLSKSQGLLAFIQNSFNISVKGAERLSQQFKWAAELSSIFPVKALSYPREMSLLPKVVDAVLKDIA